MESPQEDPGQSEGGKDRWEQTIVDDYEPPKREARKRPAGVTLVAAYLIISGIFALIAGIMALAYPDLLMEYLQEFGEIVAGAESITSEDILLFGWSMALESVLSVVLGIGLLRMKRWARFSVIAFSTFEILSALFAGFNAAFLIQALLPGLIIIYMLQPKVARFFSGVPAQIAGDPKTVQLQPQEPVEMQIKCPRCETEFTVKKEHGAPTPIKCPKCGKEGMIS